MYKYDDLIFPKKIKIESTLPSFFSFFSYPVANSSFEIVSASSPGSCKYKHVGFGQVIFRK